MTGEPALTAHEIDAARWTWALFGVWPGRPSPFPLPDLVAAVVLNCAEDRTARRWCAADLVAIGFSEPRAWWFVRLAPTLVARARQQLAAGDGVAA